MTKKDLSILIVNYKTPDLLLTCIQSIVVHTVGVNYEVIVVDNHSQDHSKELIKQHFFDVIWVDAGANLGFGKANNLAAQHASGEFFLLLNSDTACYENCIQKSLAFYQSNYQALSLGLMGIKIQSDDDSLQPSCNYFYPFLMDLIQENPLVLLVWVRLLKQNILKQIDKYNQLYFNHAVSWVGVPFALIHRELFVKLGGFDEDFFMYSEDKELNYRLEQIGRVNYFYAGTGVFHVNGGSADFAFKRSRQITVSKWLFILKAKGLSYYYSFIVLQYFNLWCDDFFYWITQFKGGLKEEDKQQKKYRLQVKGYLKKYAWKIPQQFKAKKNSSKVSLNTYKDA